MRRDSFVCFLALEITLEITFWRQTVQRTERDRCPFFAPEHPRPATCLDPFSSSLTRIYSLSPSSPLPASRTLPSHASAIGSTKFSAQRSIRPAAWTSVSSFVARNKQLRRVPDRRPVHLIVSPSVPSRTKLQTRREHRGLHQLLQSSRCQLALKLAPVVHQLPTYLADSAG
jgi:hypothetical protein